MRHLMLDIETLGTTPGCVVLSVGAVEFNENAFCGDFHAHVDIESAVQAGLKLEHRTVMWWLEQDKDAQEAMLRAEKFQLKDVLLAFNDTFDFKDLKVWANGASFDFPIIDAAYKAAGVAVPWMYYNQMDYRTLKHLVDPQLFLELRAKPNLKHDALSDAYAQAITLQRIINWVNKDEGRFKLAA
jgi:DNA polymerase III epsilon subunit-like protein